MFSELTISNFTAGELSPVMKGRTDFAKYFSGLDTCLNMVPIKQGGATRRPGTGYAANAKIQTGTPFLVRVVPFKFSTAQPYALEFGHHYIRVFADGGPVFAAGAPLEIATSYDENDLWFLQFEQSADTLYIVTSQGGASGNGYPPATLTRLSQTNWTWQTLTLLDGPYLSLNSTPETKLSLGGLAGATVSGSQITSTGAIRLTVNSTAGFGASPVNIAVDKVQGTVEANGQWQANVVDGTHLDLIGSAWQNAWTAGGSVIVLSGPVTVTANQLAGINGGAGFSSADIGRALRILATDGSATGWVWLLITAITSTGQVTATVQPNTVTTYPVPFGTSPSSQWQLGAFSEAQGWPGFIRLWQQRLVLMGTSGLPGAVWGSVTGAWTTFGTTNPDGTVDPSNGIFFVLGEAEINAGRWMSPAGSAQFLQLGIGTAGGEFVLSAATPSQAFSAENIQVYPETDYGSAPFVVPLRIGKAVIFTDPPGRKLREWSFYWQVNGYLGPDKNQLSDHITRGPDGTDPSTWGLRWICWQQSPHQVIWGGRNDGGLVSFTYDREQDVWAPARHQLGGNWYGGAPIVESGCVIPAPDQSYDQLWLSVLRTVGGTPLRTIEFMTRYFDGARQDQSRFTDCAVSSSLTSPSSTLTPQGFTPSPPAAGTQAMTMPTSFSGAGAFVGDELDPAPFFGNANDVGKIVRCNGGIAIVTQGVDSRHVNATMQTPMWSMAPAGPGAWSATQKFTSFSGMSFAAGETVSVLADGADAGLATVGASGGIFLPFAASHAVAGFPYTPVLVSMPMEPQRAAAAAAGGRLKRLSHLYLRFYQTGAAFFGRRLTDPENGLAEDLLERLEMRISGRDALGQAPPLFSGVKRLDGQGGWDREGQIVIAQDGPLPLTVLSINASAELGEMPVAAP